VTSFSPTMHSLAEGVGARVTSSLKITGLGILNSCGVGRSHYWSNLLAMVPGVSAIEGFDTHGYSCNVGAQVKGFDAKTYMSSRFYRRLSRLSQLAVAASIEAVRDSGLEINDSNRHRIGTVFGTAFGSTEQTEAFFLSLLEHGPQSAEPFLFPDTVPNAPASHVAMYHRLQGPNCTLCHGHLSGECALAYAAMLLEQGQADAVVVGGVDELSPILFHSLSALRALKPLRHMGPLPPNQIPTGKGIILGEGATCMVLERADLAAERAKTAYGSLLAIKLGGAAAMRGHYHTDGGDVAEAMAKALDESGLQASEIDLIGLAANGTAELESAEARALEQVGGTAWQRIPRMAIRYFVGEFGAAGLLTMATLLLALTEDVVPPTLRDETLAGPSGAPERFRSAMKAPVNLAMAVGANFGGGGACLILTKDPPQ